MKRHEPLTGLPNREYLRERFPGINESCDDRTWILIGLRLTDLRAVNERLGRTIGDAFVRCYANALSERLPPEAFLCCTEGVMFVVLMPLDGWEDLTIGPVSFGSLCRGNSWSSMRRWLRPWRRR